MTSAFPGAPARLTSLPLRPRVRLPSVYRIGRQAVVSSTPRSVIEDSTVQIENDTAVYLAFFHPLENGVDVLDLVPGEVGRDLALAGKF